MKLGIALSSLQGRLMSQAIPDLLLLELPWLQLTPGNYPNCDAKELLQAEIMKGNIQGTSVHHGFSYHHRRLNVWLVQNDESIHCNLTQRSVHPPKLKLDPQKKWRNHLEQWLSQDLIFETMYPGYDLGDNESLCWAMSENIPLAVDISHVFMQKFHGTLNQKTWQRLQDYNNIQEIHVSANMGKHDSHLPINKNTFGLEWAKEKLQDGAYVVYESYLHKMNKSDRQKQIDLIRC